jgi:membrane fusion protein (multidrug efflux system)
MKRFIHSLISGAALACMAGGFASGCKPAGAPGQAGAAAKGGGGMAFQVVAVEARRQPVAEVVSLVGTVVPNESVEIKSEADGVVQTIGFSEGQSVEAGALLVALDQTKFQASLQESEASLELSRANHERAQQMFRDKLIAQQEFDQAAATFRVNQSAVELRRRLLKDARVVAPFAGTTGARQVSPGQVISRNTLLTTLMDLSVMKVELSLPERFLGQVRTGQKVEFRVDAFPQERFSGEVYFISPQLDPGTRTALVKARVANPEARLRGGMLAQLDLSVRLRESALVIPEPSIIASGDTNMVFVVGPQGQAVMRPVRLGLRLAGRAEVLQGVEPGEKVVVEGVKKIFPGAPLKLSGPESAAPYVQ